MIPTEIQGLQTGIRFCKEQGDNHRTNALHVSLTERVSDGDTCSFFQFISAQIDFFQVGMLTKIANDRTRSISNATSNQ